MTRLQRSEKFSLASAKVSASKIRTANKPRTFQRDLIFRRGQTKFVDGISKGDLTHSRLRRPPALRTPSLTSLR